MINIYEGKESDLRELPANHPDRPAFEEEFAGHVRRTIDEVRNGQYINLWLIIESLKNPTGSHGFQTWFGRLGVVVGKKTVARIGKDICKEMSFDLKEAGKLKEDYRRSMAKSLSLPENASWVEIEKANQKKHSRHNF